MSSQFQIRATINAVSDIDRKLRAERRRHRTQIRYVRTSDVDVESSGIRGIEAISLAWQLSKDAWAISGQPFPEYDREKTPVRVIKRQPSSN